MTPKEIAEKYVYGKHNALTDRQEVKDMIIDIENYAQELKQVKNIVNEPILSVVISPEYLIKLHPELNYEEAKSLTKFAKSKTIEHKECYGNGSIILPMWKAANNR